MSCHNAGNIFTEAKGWGWPNSSHYRHQTGGVVGLFWGGSSTENTLMISECTNYGNVEIVSFTFYNVANSSCENGCTGGICGGFEGVVSSSNWYGIISDCTNYAQHITSTRTKNVDGELVESPDVGRICGHIMTPYYSFANNFSDSKALINGKICTENIGAYTQNGANLGEETLEPTFDSSVFLGTWFNGMTEDNYSGFYLTEFTQDSIVIQKGYRNLGKGSFVLNEDNSVTATYTINYWDTTGIGYQQIEDYSYIVT